MAMSFVQFTSAAAFGKDFVLFGLAARLQSLVGNQAVRRSAGLRGRACQVENRASYPVNQQGSGSDSARGLLAAAPEEAYRTCQFLTRSSSFSATWFVCSGRPASPGVPPSSAADAATVSNAITAPLKALSTNPNYFSDGSGKAIYLTGSHTWNNLQDWGTDGSVPTSGLLGVCEDALFTTIISRCYGRRSCRHSVDFRVARLAGPDFTVTPQPDIEWIEANAFDLLKDYASSNRRYDTVILDPPAFAKTKRDLDPALRGYKELNLRALKMLRPGGILVTCSCSYHVSQSNFLEMLADAGLDAHRTLRLVEVHGQAKDHPVLLNVPETAYLKCVIATVS